MAFLDFTMFQSQDFFIPFIFILAIVFGSLELTKVFKNKGVNLLISLALAFFAASNASFIEFLWSQFGNISIFFIAMFFIIFILEAFGIRGKPGKDTSDAIIINGAILFILLSVSSLFVNSLPALPVVGGGQNLLLLLFILFILVIFWLAHRLGPEGH